MIFKQCNRLHYISNRLQVNLNVGIQNQLWRVTTFHKMHCVIDYTFVVIDYQWTILKKKLRVITLNMVFSKVTILPMISLTRHEESIKTWLWYTFKKHIWYSSKQFFFIIFLKPLPIAFSLPKSFLNFVSKLCFFLQVEILQKTKVCYLFIPSPSCQKIQRTNRLRILLILPSPSWQKIQRTNRLRILLILPFPFKQKISKD